MCCISIAFFLNVVLVLKIIIKIQVEIKFFILMTDISYLKNRNQNENEIVCMYITSHFEISIDALYGI